MNKIIVLCSGAVFIYYGLLCLITNHMMIEFKRYGLSRFRRIVGVLELLGGLGLLLGFYYPIVSILASAGLTVLMFFGTIVRLKTKDPLWEIIPAFTLMLLNGYIFFQLLLRIR